ncbi:MAG: TolC family protein [Spirochaetales bacterium]|nr:TolC family protein [Spirochaetales bacterium]
MNKKIVIFLLLLITVISSLMATSLSKEEIISLALSNNKTLEIAKLELQNSLNSSSVNTLLPSISLESGINLTGSILNKQLNVATPTASTTVSFTISSKDKYQSESKELASLSANLGLEVSTSTVLQSVTTSYWNTASSFLAVQIAENNLETANTTCENQKAKYESGKLSSLALSQAELAVKDAQLSLENAKTTYESSLSNLEYLTGLQALSLATPDFTSSSLLPLEMLYELCSQSLSYQKGSLAVEQAKLTDKINHNTLVSPTYSFSAKVGISTSYSLSYNSSWTNNFSVTDNSSLSATISIPLDHLFSSSSASVTLQNSKNTIEIQQLSLNNTLEELKNQVKSSYNSIESNLRTQENTAEYLTLAKTQLEKTQESYEHGYASFTELQTAQNAVFVKEISLLQLQLNYHIALDNLATLLNTDIKNITK